MSGMKKHVERREDMSPRGKLSLYRQGDGDIIVSACPDPDNSQGMEPASVEFCTRPGGGCSPNTLKALYVLMDAMEQDNEEEAQHRRPEPSGGGVEWTRDPIPEGEKMGMPNVGHYFFAELHKGDWMLSLRDAWNTGGYEPNTPHWMRSPMIVFPDPPTGEGEEP